MTVIAWDGTTLAADRQAAAFGAKYQVTKIFRRGDILIGLAGGHAHSTAMLEWLCGDRSPATFPPAPAEQGDEGYLLVIHRDGRVERFEHSPHPCRIEEKQFGDGGGRDFALAAMYCGKTAAEAVEIASRLSNCCGLGIDTLTFDSPESP